MFLVGKGFRREIFVLVVEHQDVSEWVQTFLQCALYDLDLSLVSSFLRLLKVKAEPHQVLLFYRRPKLERVSENQAIVVLIFGEHVESHGRLT